MKHSHRSSDATIYMEQKSLVAARAVTTRTDHHHCSQQAAGRSDRQVNSQVIMSASKRDFKS